MTGSLQIPRYLSNIWQSTPCLSIQALVVEPLEEVYVIDVVLLVGVPVVLETVEVVKGLVNAVDVDLLDKVGVDCEVNGVVEKGLVLCDVVEEPLAGALDVDNVVEVVDEVLTAEVEEDDVVLESIVEDAEKLELVDEGFFETVDVRWFVVDCV